MAGNFGGGFIWQITGSVGASHKTISCAWPVSTKFLYNYVLKGKYQCLANAHTGIASGYRNAEHA